MMQKNTTISEEDLKRYRALFVKSVWRQIYESFLRQEKKGLTRKILADRLGVNKSVISRRLNGSCNFTIEILSDMARSLETKPEVKLIAYADLTHNKEPYAYQPTKCYAVINGAGRPEGVSSETVVMHETTQRHTAMIVNSTKGIAYGTASSA